MRNYGDRGHAPIMQDRILAFAASILHFYPAPLDCVIAACAAAAASTSPCAPNRANRETRALAEGDDLEEEEEVPSARLDGIYRRTAE